MRTVNDHPFVNLPAPLTRKEEQTATSEELVRHNLRLAVNMAKRSAHFGLQFDDVLSIAILVLVEASRAFDVGRGCKFSTYAMTAIRRRFTVDIPKCRDHIRMKWRAEGERGAVCSRAYEMAHQALYSSVSMSDRGVGWMKAKSVEAEDETWGDEDVEWVRVMLEKLPARERVVIQGRFFEDKTLDEVGRVVGVGKERVRQIQEKALSRLRDLMGA